MAKIGILINTKKIKSRAGQEKFSFDDVAYWGLNAIIKEIDKKNKIDFVSSKYINDYDFVLYSITSYYDYFNLIFDLKNMDVKTKLIIGGAGFLNIWPIYDFVWAACFGRGENIINDIFEQKPLLNVWYKNIDPDIKSVYKIGELKQFLKIDNLDEQSIGCQKKCFFCQYGWMHKYKQKENSDFYKSGYSDREVMFIDINWDKKCRYFVSAFDGSTEAERKIVNKALSNKQIKQTILKRNDSSRKKTVLLKLYNITHYPFLKEDNYREIQDVFTQADKELKYKLTILFNCTAFKPMPLTPMQSEKVNIDYKIKEVPFLNLSFLRLIKGYSSSSVVPAMENTIVNRLGKEDIFIFNNIFSSKKYASLKSFYKKQILIKYFDKYLQEFENPIPYIERPQGLAAAEKKYYLNKKGFCNGI